MDQSLIDALDKPTRSAVQQLASEISDGTTVDVTNYAAVGDAVRRTGTVASGALSTLTVTASLPGSAVGKTISVGKADSAGVHPFVTTVASVTGGGVTIGLTDPIPRTAGVTAQEVIVGTNDTAAIDDAHDAAEATGRTLLFPPGKTFLITQAIKCRSGMTYRNLGRIINRASGTNVHPLERAVFAPGFVHANGFWVDAVSANKLPHYAVNNITAGAVTITGTTGGQLTAAAGVTVGEVVALRLITAATSDAGGGASDEFPDALYFARIVAKSGDVLTMADPAPWAMTGAQLVVIDPAKLTYGSFTHGAENQWLIQDVTIEGGELDAAYPLWGGGCYGFSFTGRAAGTSPYSGTPNHWAGGLTLNAMSHATFDMVGDFTEMAVELKLGSGHCRVDYRGSYRTGPTTYHPMSVGESAHDLDLGGVDITVGSAFNDSSKNFFDTRNCSNITLTGGRFRLTPTAINNMIAVAGGARTYQATRNLTVDGMEFITGTGVARLLDAGTDSATVAPSGVQFTRNRHSGAVSAQALRIQAGTSYLIGDDNVFAAGSTFQILPAAGGYFPPRAVASSTANTTSMRVAKGALTPSETQVDFATLTGGVIPMWVIFETLTAWNGTGTNTLEAGTTTEGTRFASAVPAGSVTSHPFYGNVAATAGTGGYGLGFRVGDPVTFRAKYNGTSPSLGATNVYVGYIGVD